MPSATASGPSSFSQLRIVHAALATSVLIYGVVVYLAVVKAEPPQPAPPAAQTLVIVLGVVALSVMGAIPVLRAKLLPPAAAAPRGGSGAAPGVFPGSTGAAGEGGGGNQLSAADRAKLFTGSIVTWAMCESIAIFGLVASFVTHRGWPFPIFAAVSLVNFVIYRPRRVAGA